MNLIILYIINPLFFIIVKLITHLRENIQILLFLYMLLDTSIFCNMKQSKIQRRSKKVYINCDCWNNMVILWKYTANLGLYAKTYKK